MSHIDISTWQKLSKIDIKEVVNMSDGRYFAAISANCPLYEVKAWAREHAIGIISGAIILPAYDNVVELELDENTDLVIVDDTFLDGSRSIGCVGYDRLLGETVAVITPMIQE